LEGEVKVPTETEKKIINKQLSADEVTKVISLKIRSETGKRTMLLTVLYNEEISTLYELLKPYAYRISFKTKFEAKIRISNYGEATHRLNILMNKTKPWKNLR
jgi:hypothetical protein